MKEKIKIANRMVGKGEPCFVMVDLGVNHDNKLSQAIELIDVAVEAKVDAVKLQLYYADGLWPRKSRSYEILKPLETPREWLDELMSYSEKKGMMLLATPFDKEAVDLLEKYNPPTYKWASSEIFDLPLLKYTASKKRPMVISTGVSDLADVQKAVDVTLSAGNEDIILLHCVSAYPTEPKDVHLRMMDTLAAAFHYPVGFSDHTTGISVPIAAVARGACMIEKHYTLSRKLVGPDHGFALEPKELCEMVKSIREVEQSLGSPVKKPIKNAENLEYFTHLFTARKINEGEVIDKNALAVKRSNYGIRPELFDTLVGRKARTSIEADVPITWEMI